MILVTNSDVKQKFPLCYMSQLPSDNIFTVIIVRNSIKFDHQIQKVFEEERHSDTLL